MRTKQDIYRYVEDNKHAPVKIYFEDHDTIIIYGNGKLIHYELNGNDIISTNVLKSDQEKKDAMK